METDKDPFSFNGLTLYQNCRMNQRCLTTESALCNYFGERHGRCRKGESIISVIILRTVATLFYFRILRAAFIGRKIKIGRHKEVGIFGIKKQVHAEIGEIKSMSAHGDYEDLFQWLACQDPRKVKKLFLVHGEYDVQIAFKNRLLKKDFFDIEIPERHYEVGIPQTP